MLTTRNLRIFVFFLIVIVMLSLSVSALNFALYVDGERCGDDGGCSESYPESSYCHVDEMSLYTISADDARDVDGYSYDIISGPFIDISDVEGVDQNTDDLKYTFPSINEQVVVKIRHSRTGFSEYYDACGYFVIEDVVPTKHGCYGIETMNCSDEPLVAYNNIELQESETGYPDAVVGNLSAEDDGAGPVSSSSNYRIHSEGSSGLLTLGFNLSDLNASLNITDVLLPVTTAGGFTVQDGVVNVSSPIRSLVDTITVDSSLNISGNLSAIAGPLFIDSSLNILSGLEVFGESIFESVPLIEHKQHVYSYYRVFSGDATDPRCGCDIGDQQDCCNADNCDNTILYFYEDYGDRCKDVFYFDGQPASHLFTKSGVRYQEIEIPPGLNIHGSLNMDGGGIELGDIYRRSWPGTADVGIENLVKNPGFEAGITDWTASKAATMFLDSDAPEGHGDMIRLAFNDDTSSTFVLTQNISEVYADQFALSGWFKLSTSQSWGGVSLWFLQFNSSDDLIKADRATSSLSANNWRKLDTYFDITAEAASYSIRVGLNNNLNGEYLFIDNIQLEPSLDIYRFRPRQLNLVGDAQFMDVEARGDTNVANDLIVYSTANLGGLSTNELEVYEDVDVGGSITASGDVKAETLYGKVNLRSTCDTKSNTVRAEGRGIAFQFASGAECGVEEPCMDNSDCMTNCIDNICEVP